MSAKIAICTNPYCDYIVTDIPYNTLLPSSYCLECGKPTERILTPNGIIANMEYELKGERVSSNFWIDQFNRIDQMYRLTIADNEELRAENKSLKERVKLSDELHKRCIEIIGDIGKYITEDMG